MRPMENYLGQCTFPDKARVNNGCCIASHPTPAVVRASKRIKAQPRRPKNLTVEGLLGQAFQPVEQFGVEDHVVRSPSKMHAVQKLVDRGKYFINAALLHQVRRSLVVQQALTREQPQPCIVRLIDI